MGYTNKIDAARIDLRQKISHELEIAVDFILPYKKNDEYEEIEVNKDLIISDEQATKLCFLCGEQYEYNGFYSIGGESIVLKVKNHWNNRIEILKIANNVIRKNDRKSERFFRGLRIQSILHRKLMFGIPDIFGININNTYATMEYVTGESLMDFLTRNYANENLIIGIFLKILEIVSEVHISKYVHRDIKPQNFKITKHPKTGKYFPVLLDFGMAKIPFEEVESCNLTSIGQELGTLAYSSPEQIDDAAKATYDDDIFSLGKLFHVMLSWKNRGFKLPKNSLDYSEKLLPGKWLKIYLMAVSSKQFRYKTALAFSNDIKKEMQDNENFDSLDNQETEISEKDVEDKILINLADEMNKKDFKNKGEPLKAIDLSECSETAKFFAKAVFKLKDAKKIIYDKNGDRIEDDKK